ncbi:MAG: hypothetical protein IT370_06125 [Deltaproteobacteria bacterium]|nr:hypothetical protein [Deltaproteobacteria bacterium]
MRNPLNALQINVGILEQELAALVPDQKAHVYLVLAKISSELTSLDNFVSEFLRYARPPRLKLEAVNIRPLLNDLAMFISPECAKKGVALTLSLDAGPVVVVVDNFQLKHAVLNLVLNALQATPPGGKISLSTGGDQGQLLIVVRDTGEGITESALAHVFDVFFTMREGGTGLGLPITRRIIEEHGGTLELSTRAGAGTTATISLPTKPRA